MIAGARTLRRARACSLSSLDTRARDAHTSSFHFGASGAEATRGRRPIVMNMCFSQLTWRRLVGVAHIAC